MGWVDGVVCDRGAPSSAPVHCACQFSGDPAAIQSFVPRHLVPLLYQVLMVKARRLRLEAKSWPSDWQLTLSCQKDAGSDVQCPSQGKCGLSPRERTVSHYKLPGEQGNGVRGCVTLLISPACSS